MRSLVIGIVAACLLGRPLIAALGQSPRQAEPPKAKQDTKEAAKKDEPKKKAPGLPLKPDRTIEFTTDEGTWVSLDVSPDGKTILFELLGDLYTAADRRGRGQGDHHGPGVRQPAAVLARRQDDRVRERPRRRREPVGRGKPTARTRGR